MRNCGSGARRVADMDTQIPPVASQRPSNIFGEMSADAQLNAAAGSVAAQSLLQAAFSRPDIPSVASTTRECGSGASAKD